MHHPDRRIEVIGNRQVAPRTAGGQNLRPGLLDIVHLAFRDLPRGIGMLHLEGTAAAAAVVGAGEFHVFDAGDGLEKVSRLGADLLPLHQMAGIMVGDPKLVAVGLHLGQPLLVFVDKDRDVLQLAGQHFRRPDLFIGHFLTQLPQVAEQVGILVFERRAAGGAVDDDGVHILAGEELQSVPDALERRVPLSGHEDGKAAAGLVFGNDDLHAHFLQDFHNGPTDLAVQVVRGATMKIQDPRFRLSFGLDDLGNRFRKGFVVEGRDPLHAQGAGVELRFDPGASEHLAGPLAEPGRGRHLPLAGQKLEHHFLFPVDAVALRGPPADAGEEVIAVNAAGTIGHAGSAQEAGGEKGLLHIVGQLQGAFGKVAGELHLAPGRCLLQQEFLIDRAMGDAQTAFDAVIDIFSGIFTEHFFLFHNSMTSSSSLLAGTRCSIMSPGLPGDPPAGLSSDPSDKSSRIQHAERVHLLLQATHHQNIRPRLSPDADPCLQLARTGLHNEIAVMFCRFGGKLTDQIDERIRLRNAALHEIGCQDSVAGMADKGAPDPRCLRPIFHNSRGSPPAWR